MQAFFNYIKKAPIIKIGSKFYKPYDIYGEDGAVSTITNVTNLTVGSTAFDLFYNNLNFDLIDEDGSHDYVEGTPNSDTFSLAWSYNRHALGLRELFTECKAKAPITAPVLQDAPYYMFAIPYSDDLAIYNGNSLVCQTNKQVAMNAAVSICEKAGQGAVYDVQLLPYCPVRDAIKVQHKINEALISPATYNYVIGSTERFGIVRYYKQEVVQLNHQYIISKDLTFDSNNRFYGISSESPIKVKIGTNNLENPLTPTEDYHRIEVRYSNINDTTSTVKIFLYKASIPTPIDTPLEIDYATYCAGNQLVGVYFTDACKYGSISPAYVITYNILPTNRLALTLSYKMFNDYYYAKDSYLSKVDISNVSTSNIVTVIEGVETNVVNTIFWANESQFTFDKFFVPYLLLQADSSYKETIIPETAADMLAYGEDIVETKVKSQTELVRLASPNYSNFFDINAQMNEGIKSFNIDCTYKPYQPYIHVNPDFGGLYGADYNDVRGLICGGDYSVAITTDAWATYQLQNKNYQAVFDRQMQQLEVSHSIQSQLDVANAISGVGTGAIGGALVGAKGGGGYGAIAGAIVGGVSSAVGGAVDIYNNQRMRELQMSTLKDIHNLQLDNIKALPIGLAKTSYLTNNNRIFPFLEFYKATPVEEMAMRNLIDYNGMTINRIGKIKEFQSDKQLPYIKAQLLRIDIQDDSHQAIAISDELRAGVYLPKNIDDNDSDSDSDE
jgi:outer membrane lipoprotein SlyB